jgi:hypothetical protein
LNIDRKKQIELDIKIAAALAKKAAKQKALEEAKALENKQLQEAV